MFETPQKEVFALRFEGGFLVDTNLNAGFGSRSVVIFSGNAELQQQVKFLMDAKGDINRCGHLD